MGPTRAACFEEAVGALVGSLADAGDPERRRRADRAGLARLRPVGVVKG